ncbi:ABC transporter ATP-binding protein [Paenarthrobacter sp. FR1]|uniref:ABC transporter ATP-binding protein n=1 Tax=Paenarthrobacter sp. FR1 TaxID=3439548 RepID=UPI003DA41B03
MLRIIDLSKRYGRKNVFRKASLTIPSTGIHILRGENGDGKTTLLKCLAGLERHQGSVLWHNDSLTNNVAAAFDDSTLHGSLTGLQNLSALLDMPAHQIPGDYNVKKFVAPELLLKRSATYSLGQRKRSNWQLPSQHGNRAFCWMSRYPGWTVPAGRACWNCWNLPQTRPVFLSLITNSRSTGTLPRVSSPYGMARFIEI